VRKALSLFGNSNWLSKEDYFKRRGVHLKAAAMYQYLQSEDPSRRRSLEQWARFEAASRLGTATPQDQGEVCALARIFDEDPEGRSFADLWRAISPALFETFRT
jgi:hypothetical protein